MTKGILGTLMWVMSADAPLVSAQRDFHRMVKLTRDMVLEANVDFWTGPLSDERRRALFDKDLEVNQLERSIRRQVAMDMAGSPSMSLTTALKLMSLVKDVERIGDYAKNLVELTDLGDAPLAPSPEHAHLRRVSDAVTALVCDMPDAVAADDAEAALRLYALGREVCADCDCIVAEVARSEHRADAAVRLAVGARYYKRVVGHVMNVLSSVLMPVHKLDFFDEAALDTAAS